jgi:hypothetical protein
MSHKRKRGSVAKVTYFPEGCIVQNSIIIIIIIIIIITILPAPKRAFQQVITNHLYATNNIYTPTNIHTYIHTYIQTQIKIL